MGFSVSLDLGKDNQNQLMRMDDSKLKYVQVHGIGVVADKGETAG
jgi:hypothetical protein